MKVTKLFIDNYKVFKDFHLDLTHDGKPQDLIVLAGVNGSGKTTILEVINGLLNGGYGTYKSDVNANPELKFALDYVKVNSSREISDSSKLEFYSNIKNDFPNANLGLIDPWCYYLPVATIETDDVERVIQNYIDEQIYDYSIVPFDAYSNLALLYNNILKDFDITVQFSKLTASKNPVFKNKLSESLDLNDLSNGEKYLISLITSLYVKRATRKTILIDEPEFSLHPSWQNKIVSVLELYAKEYNCQIILATHSPQIIGSVKPEQLRLLYKDNETGYVKSHDPANGSYGWNIEKILLEVMGVSNLRTPEIDKKFYALKQQISNNDFHSSQFKKEFEELETILGKDDLEIIFMRFEMAKKDLVK